MSGAEVIAKTISVPPSVRGRMNFLATCTNFKPILIVSNGKCFHNNSGKDSGLADKDYILPRVVHILLIFFYSSYIIHT